MGKKILFHICETEFQKKKKKKDEIKEVNATSTNS